MSTKSRPVASLLIFAIAACVCPVIEGQMFDQPHCQQRDVTLLDYKMVNMQESPRFSLEFTNIDAQDIITLYAKLSGLELIVDSHAKIVHASISVQAYGLTQSQQLSLVERALKEQAGIIIKRLDDKRAAVMYDSTLPIKKSKG